MNSLNDLLEMTTEMVTNIVKEAWENGFAEGKKEKEAEHEPELEPEPKPCPFCGGKPLVSVIRPSTGVVEAWRIYCECGASTKWGKSKREAIEAWNRRA